MIEGAAGIGGAPTLARLMRLGGAYAASNLVRLACGLVAALLLARGLGPAEFGRWTLWSAWAGLLTMTFDCGLGTLVTRDVAKDPRDAGRIVAGAAAIRLAVFAPAALGLWLIVPVAVTPEAARAARLIVLVTVAGLAYGSLAAGFRAVPRHVPAILAVETAGAALVCAGAAAAVALGASATVMLGVLLGVQLLQVAAALVLWGRRFAGCPLRGSGLRDLWVLLVRAWPFALSGLVANGQARLAPALLGIWSSPHQLAMFGAASRLSEAAKLLPYSMFAGALPAFTAADPAGRADLQARFHVRLSRYSIAAAIALSAGAYPLTSAVFGRPYLDGWPVLVALALGLPATLANSGRKLYLIAEGREADAVRWGAASLVLQIAATSLLVPQWGALGAALALGAGEWLVHGRLQRAWRKPALTSLEARGRA